jgi:aspartate 1-decarboxylase
MFRKVLASKIHRATITHADLDYEGSITLPPDLLQAANMLEFEAVCIWNVTRGSRFETYTIEGIPGSRDICVNGAAAHLVKPGDLIIIASFKFVEADFKGKIEPKVVFVDANNNIKSFRREVAGPQRMTELMA